MAHIVLLGDSIFDNAPNVPAGTEVQARLQSLLEATLLADWQADFRRDYRRMLNVVLSRRKPVALATIYEGVPGLDPGLRTALAPFNDVILREQDPAALRTLVYAGASF